MSKMIEISKFYRVSVANVANDCEGDFLDALSNDRNANSYFFAVCDENSKIIAYHVDTGNVVIDTGSIDEAVEKFMRFTFDGGYPEPILKPILLAAIYNDKEVLAEAFEKETFRVYSLRETDEVTNYKSRIEELVSICGFGAASYDTGAYFDLESREITFEGEVFENLSDLSGYFDEDSWVVVLRPYRSSSDESAPSVLEDPSPPTKAVQRFCTECGNKLVDAAKFCGECGAKVKLAEANERMVETLDKSTLFDIKNYRVLRFGVANSESEGDFIDNINPSLNLVVATLTCDQAGKHESYLVIQNDQFGHVLFKDMEFSEVIEQLISKLGVENLCPHAVFAGLACSTESQDVDGIAKHCPCLEEQYFEASETDLVEEYGECIFGIGSKTEDTGASFDLNTNTVKFGDEEFSSLSDVYGYFDEDSTWVVCISK